MDEPLTLSHRVTEEHLFALCREPKSNDTVGDICNGA